MYFTRQATLTITGHADELVTRDGRFIARFGNLEIELQDASASPPAGDVLTIEADLVGARWRAARVLGIRANVTTGAHNTDVAQANTINQAGRTPFPGTALARPDASHVQSAAAAASPFASLAGAGKGASRPSSSASSSAGRSAVTGVGTAGRAVGTGSAKGLNAGARAPRAAQAPTVPLGATQVRPGFDPDAVNDLDDDLPF